MKLLLLLGLIVLVFGQETIVSTRSNENKEIEQQQGTTILQLQPNGQEGEANKKLTKRSFGWGPWGYGGGYGGYGWPWYGGWGGGWYGGWYPGWPWWYGGYGGWYGHGGWYKKW